MINLASLLIFSLVLRRYVMLKGKKVCSVLMDAFQLEYLTLINPFKGGCNEIVLWRISKEHRNFVRQNTLEN